MKFTYVALSLLGMISYSSAQFDAKRCLTYNDCPSTLCCGTATPQIARYGTVHKICYIPTKKHYMNYNGYNFDFECDKIETNTPVIEDNSNEDLNAEKDQYEGRFWSGHKASDPQNLNGYGVDNVWVPPIAQPDSLVEIYDRFMLTTRLNANPLILGVTGWLEGFGQGDSYDGYWYANKAAAGSQLYPTGLSKYFDLHSVDGLFAYSFQWIWDSIQFLALPFTFLIPVDVWLALIGGASLDDVWKILLFYEPFVYITGGLPSLVAWYFDVKMEDGWGIMYN